MNVILILLTILYSFSLGYLAATFKKPFVEGAQFSGGVDISQVKKFIPLPLMRQSLDFTCGVAATQSIVSYYGENLSEGDLSKELFPDPQEGTTADSIYRYFKSQRYQVHHGKNWSIKHLENAIDQGRPTLVMIQAWPEQEILNRDWSKTWDAGHWVVVVGYDKERLYFMDPYISGQYTFMTKPEFELRWHDVDGVDGDLHRYGMTVWKNTSRILSPNPKYAIPTL